MPAEIQTALLNMQAATQAAVEKNIGFDHGERLSHLHTLRDTYGTT